MTSQSTDSIRFGPFLLETGRRLLRNGRRVPISPIELKLLETLLRNRDRVLAADELRILVWAGDPTTDVVPSGDPNALYVAVRKLRKSLGSYAKWIVNVPKAGYTIAEEVQVEVLETSNGTAFDSGTLFVGRRDDLDNLKELLTKTGLLTLTGSPGIGKSRLASALAAEVANDYPDGVLSVDFVPVENGALVPKTVLTALGLVAPHNATDLEVISDHLKESRMLIVLDNCEHLVEACSLLADHLLHTAPGVQMIAASREPFLLLGETVMTVPPLTFPAYDDVSASSGSGQSESVELFLTLAKQHRPDIEFDTREMELVAELCRRLEGIPLAIELAAVQVGSYTVEQIVEGSSDALRLLWRRGGEDERHKTLEDAINWSYSELKEQERSLLRRLSVFSGQWTSEPAAAICADDGVEESDVVHLLACLVRQSLIQLTGENGNHRYRMLKTIRQFCRDRLRDSGDADDVYARHDRYFLALAENAFEAGAKGNWMERVDAEYDNIRSVLERSIRQQKNSELGLRMCGALAKYWFNYGHMREAMEWIEPAIEADDSSSPFASAGAFRAAGFFLGQMAGTTEELELGRTYFEKSIALWQSLGDQKHEAFTLCHYSFLLNRLGLFSKSRSAARRSFEIAAASGDHANIARSVNNFALTLLDVGEAEDAKLVFEDALAEARIAEDHFLEAVCLHNLGEAAAQMGDLEYAEEYLADSIELLKSVGNRPLVAYTHLLQGEVATLKNEWDEALNLEREALEEFLEIEDNQGIASALEAIALTHVRSGENPALFLTLNSAAAELRRNIDLRIGPARGATLQNVAHKATASLGETAADSAIKSGSSMRVSEAVEMALTVD